MNKIQSPKKWKYGTFIVVFVIISLEILLRLFGINDTYLERVGKEYYTYWGKKQGWYHTGSPHVTYTEKTLISLMLLRQTVLDFGNLNRNRHLKKITPASLF